MPDGITTKIARSFGVLSLLVLPIGSVGQTGIAIASDEEFCGLGPAPDSPEFAASLARRDAQRSLLGYEKVCDQNLGRFDLQRDARPSDSVLSKLAFIPVNLVSTPWARYQPIGAIAEGRGTQELNAVTRLFRRDDGLIVSLFEWDLSIDGGGTAASFRPPDLIVNGWPGYRSILQSKSGKAYSILSWQGATRKFELVLNANVKLLGEETAFITLAESIPSGIPSGTKQPAPTIALRPRRINSSGATVTHAEFLECTLVILTFSPRICGAETSG
ncbi:MAG: hypothetical protein H0T80_08590 [Betaproteobacteria bacterium]|nr:hypothetical protein [Betaproteobacteria bacterium]